MAAPSKVDGATTDGEKIYIACNNGIYSFDGVSFSRMTTGSYDGIVWHNGNLYAMEVDTGKFYVYKIEGTTATLVAQCSSSYISWMSGVFWTGGLNNTIIAATDSDRDYPYYIEGYEYDLSTNEISRKSLKSSTFTVSGRGSAIRYGNALYLYGYDKYLRYTGSFDTVAIIEDIDSADYNAVQGCPIPFPDNSIWEVRSSAASLSSKGICKRPNPESATSTYMAPFEDKFIPGGFLSPDAAATLNGETYVFIRTSSGQSNIVMKLTDIYYKYKTE